MKLFSSIILFLITGFGFSQISVDTTIQTSDRQIDSPAYWHSCAKEADSLKLQCSEEALLDYLLEQTAQIAAHDSLVTGAVTVQFVVDSSGRTTDIRILNSLNSFCDGQAIKIIRNMPQWIPGIEKGKAIKIQYAIPIYFRKKA